MILSDEEKKIEQGELGEAAREALRMQLSVAEYYGAERFVEVTNVHMMGDIEVMGETGFAYLERVAGSGARTVVPTTTNARCFDFAHVETLGQRPERAVRERELISLLRTIGVATTDTCINYQAIYQPHLGEHVAWGDTGTVIYANSVLGARTNFESGPAALAAAITGRTPEYGFHLDENRLPTFEVRVEAPLEDLADWGMLGKLIGEGHQSYSEVPYITGIERQPTSDELKHLGASLASHGSMAMFHLPGVTPEAEVRSSDGAPDDGFVITAQDLSDAFEGYRTRRSEEAKLVVFSAPHLSLFELEGLAGLLDGERIAESVTLIVTTNRGYRTNADALGYLGAIEGAGGIVLEGVCFYILDDVAKMRDENGWHSIVTNSAKLANIIQAHRYEPVLMPTDECVRVALSGRL